MGSNRYNTGSSTWTAGLCSNVGTRTSSSGSFGSFSLSSALRIGVGDGQSGQSYDWALLVPLSGNGAGDYEGNKVWAFGGEGKSNNGHAGTVTISAACAGARFHSLKVDAILVLGGCALICVLCCSPHSNITSQN